MHNAQISGNFRVSSDDSIYGKMAALGHSVNINTMLTQQQILVSSMDDIVFQDRNRSYGAYSLRKEYDRNMMIAIGIMIGFCALAFLTGLSNGNSVVKQLTHQPGPVILDHFPEKPKPIIPPSPPPPPAANKAIRTEIFTPPLIVDDNISPDEMPPIQDDLGKAKIGLERIEGDDIGNIVAPPVESVHISGVISPKQPEMDFEKVYTTVQNPAEFPGGISEWVRYLQKNLQYPETALDMGIVGVVRVQFIVDRDGNISEVQALNDPGEGLSEEAVRIIKKGPKWRPAEQNGHKVIYRHTQAIVFRMD
jgi:protein TonB